MPHDRQRQRVYDAERRVCDQLDFAARGASIVAVAGSTIAVSPDIRFGSLQAAGRWLAELRARAWFAARWPGAADHPLIVRARRGRQRAHYEAREDGGVVAVPVPGNVTGWAMREMVLLHELAHHVVACDVAPEPADQGLTAPHGCEFAAVMLQLVDGVLGPEARLLLAAAYHGGGVEVGPRPAGRSEAGDRDVADGAAP